MLTTGAQKRMLTGSWILAALILLGYNGLELTTVLEPSVLGYSSTLKTVKEKWEKLKPKYPSSEDKPRDVTGLDLKLVKFIPGTPQQDNNRLTLPEKNLVQAESGKENTEELQIVLPHVSGIVQVTGMSGETRLLAMIEGERLSEDDRIMGFTVKKITSEGVTLIKGGKDWFVKVPQTGFSIIRTVPSGATSNDILSPPEIKDIEEGIEVK